MQNFFKTWKNKKALGTAFVQKKSEFIRTGGGNVVINEWADWLKNRPAPNHNPRTQRYMLSRYWYGSPGHEKLRLEMFDRWGYALDISGNPAGLGADTASAMLADAQTSNPSTANGRLTKLALSDPNKYRILSCISQGYPGMAEAPTGYLKDANGSLINEWSPIASPAAMQLAVDNSTSGLAVLKQAGIQVAIAYHGGETGTHILGTDIPGNMSQDPDVVAAKGSRSWFDFVSEKKADQLKLFRDKVAQLAPEKQVYVFYPCDGNMYTYNPGWYLYTWDYSFLKKGTDLPSSSNYYYEFNSDLGDPSVKGQPGRDWGSYYDLATNSMSAIVEQIVYYNQPLSYNWVCPLGWYKSSTIFDAGVNPKRLSNPLLATGYMKFAAITGSIGFVDGYFGPDCVPEYGIYPVLDPLDPPPWLINSIIISEEQARFSHLDPYIFDGDLLPGVMKLKPKNHSAYEFQGYKKIGNFFVVDQGVRCFIRKRRNSEEYLILAWAVTGLDREVSIRDIPGISPFTVKARIKGSLYTVDVVNNINDVVWQDPPLPNSSDTPVMLDKIAASNRIALKYYAPRSLSSSQKPSIQSFTINNNSISSVDIKHITKLHDEIVLTTASPIQGATTLNYIGNDFVDTENNLVPNFSFSFSVQPQLLTTLSAGVVFNGFDKSVYTGETGVNWNNSIAVSTVKLTGDGEAYCLFEKGVMLALSSESDNSGNYQTWAYTINSGVVDGNPVLAGIQAGTFLNIGDAGAQYKTLEVGALCRISRTGDVLKISTKLPTANTWTEFFTFPNTNTQTLYLHAAFGELGSKLSDLTVNGFS